MHTNKTRATGTEYIHIYFVSKYYGGLSGAVHRDKTDKEWV